MTDTSSAVVIGGGIAGIQAALDIAGAGFKVYLVEKDPSIGGHMAQLDKTFPTLDCSACILTPKMVDVARHPRIELMTYSEVRSVTRVPRVEPSSQFAVCSSQTSAAGGAELRTPNCELRTQKDCFKVEILHKPRYVDIRKCTGCGLCAQACRMKKIPSEFDAGMGKRSAIYCPFPQAVPLKYTIDAAQCLFLTRGKCGKSPACKDACTAEAIDHAQKETRSEIFAGAIVVATGFDPFDARLKEELGYGLYPNVITGLECERLCSASGPTQGKIVIEGKEPRDIVFVHCVGSRDKTIGREYCSRVCCMYILKQAHLVRDKVPHARITCFYMDVRAFGKGFEEFYDRVRGEEILFRRGNVGMIFRRGERLVVRAEDTLVGEPMEVETDLVVLGAGLVPRQPAKGLPGLAALLGIQEGQEGFFKELNPKTASVRTEMPGVFLAGCCQGPKDIPDTVAHASAAAAEAIVALRRTA